MNASHHGEQRRRILAIASGGGHWVQLLRLRPAFEGCRVTYVTVREDYRADLAPGARFRVINDATRWDKVGLVKMALRLAWILLRERPHVIISTGAAPGYFAIRLGRLLGARTLWLDSIANVEEVSMTGQIVGRYADLWLTQWPHLAGPQGPRCEGAVL
ncbi:MAG: UDP-N-acetylglucosamine--LPS N-acetylglucosamine transferase [Planctomycetota bacterium]|nr:UDP-N-acetylglucosamine--LPS N-acetylglucosamine transferase [Planctomycetota bacterium]